MPRSANVCPRNRVRYKNPYTPTADDPTTPDMWKPNESDLDGLVTSDESPSIARGSVTLGQSVVITGKIKGNEDLTIEGRVEGERNGKRLDVGCCIAFEIKDGRIVSGREHFYDLYAWDEFWS